MGLTTTFKKGILWFFGRKQQKPRGGRRRKTIPSLLDATYYHTLQHNDRMRMEVAFKKHGNQEILEKFSLINLKREELLAAALERAIEIINSNPALLNQFALKNLYDVLGLDPPPELTAMAKPPLTQAEKNAQKLEGLAQLLEHIKLAKSIGAEIDGGGSKGGGISRILTPELILKALSMVTALIAPQQQANDSQSSRPAVILETPDGVFEMSSLEYQKYLAGKGLAGQTVPELESGSDSQALPETPVDADGDPQSGRPAGADESSTPVSLRVSAWTPWVGRDPAEFVRNAFSKAAEGDDEAQATLSFLRCYSLQEIAAILEANKGGSNDPALEPAITILLAHQDWLQAVMELIRQQDGAPGEVQG